MSLRKGRISLEEDRIIKENLETPIEELAKRLNRSKESLIEYIKRKYGVDPTSEDIGAYVFRSRPFYKQLKEQFTLDELELFEYHWNKTIEQFNRDIPPTEELQIIDLIKLEVLCNRCLITNRRNLNEISVLEAQLKVFESKIMPAPDEIEAAAMTERNLAGLRAAQEAINKDYRELLAKKMAILKDMKATREQRVKRIEDSKESFTAWVASLMTDHEKLKRYGVEMELMRLAALKEKERLGAYHQYIDKQVDQPFLNCDTVLED
jgi:hypothetical protein